MKYESQKVAMLYFYGALVLFIAQVAFGVLAGTIYVLPNTLSELLPFNIVRMIHTNALVVWLLMGFMGSTYYLLPEETETELYSTKLAVIQFWLTASLVQDDRDQHPSVRSVGPCPVLPVRLLQSDQSRTRQALLVVCHPFVG